MAILQFSARISESLELTPKFHYLHIELVEPHRIEFQAGQYILLDVPGTEQKKSYSIASSPTMDHAIELLVDISPQGAGTTYIKNLKPGDIISFRAPVGQFVVASQESEIGTHEKALLFIATGSGITPIRSMILDQLQQKKDQRLMTLYWGLRYEADLCWLDDFEDLGRSFPNFSLHLVLSQSQEEWSLCRGRVTDCLSIHKIPLDAGYYVCGNNAMIDDVKTLLLNKGVGKEYIHHEKFY
ncbi:MAG: hypothetical protein HZA34_02840 [Candidatus Pacebacteria bacterium]|nr:hypothetical protein [Candidatus Paceibacterota bacterium]